MSITSVHFRISEAPPSRLDKAVARDVPEDASLSRTRLSRLITDGAVKVNGVVVLDPKAKVLEGADVEIDVPEAEESHILPEDIPLDVIYDDDDLIVVNKPAGLVVHPAPGTPNGTLVNALMHHCGESKEMPAKCPSCDAEGRAPPIVEHPHFGPWAFNLRAVNLFGGDF